MTDISISPTWLADLFAGVMLAVAAYSLARPIYAGRYHRQANLDTDATHVLLGLALAGLLAPSVSVLPRTTWATDIWAAIFAAATVWFAWRLTTTPRADLARYASVLIACAAMVFIQLDPTYAASGGGTTAMPGMPGMAAGSSAGSAFRTPTLALLFAFAVTAFAVLATDRIALLAADGSTTEPAETASTVTRSLIASRATIACHVAVGVVLSYLLVLMLA
jgi:hypothetical protein